MKLQRHLLGICGLIGLVGCVTSSERADNVSSAQIGDVQSIERRPDGLSDVVCRDGRREVANESEILANTVCATFSPIDAGPRPHHDGGVITDGGYSPDAYVVDASPACIPDGFRCNFD